MFHQQEYIKDQCYSHYQEYIPDEVLTLLTRSRRQSISSDTTDSEDSYTTTPLRPIALRPSNSQSTFTSWNTSYSSSRESSPPPPPPPTTPPLHSGYSPHSYNAKGAFQLHNSPSNFLTRSQYQQQFQAQAYGQSRGSPLHQGPKCRQLPCRTFISTGTCPYNDRCVFLHDPRIASKVVISRAKGKPKEDVFQDAFFWTPMSTMEVMGKVDNKNLPHVSQPYVLVAPNESTVRSNHPCAARDLRSATAVFSMWNHFIDVNLQLESNINSTPPAASNCSTLAMASNLYPQFPNIDCHATGSCIPRFVHSQKDCDSNGIEEKLQKCCYDENSRNEINRYTGRRRLSVFLELASQCRCKIVTPRHSWSRFGRG